LYLCKCVKTYNKIIDENIKKNVIFAFSINLLKIVIMNMQKKILVCCFLITSFYGCEKKDIIANYTNLDSTFTVPYNCRFTIMLPDYTDGYDLWMWNNKKDVKIVKCIKKEYIEIEGRIGLAGKQVWTFDTKKQGEEKLVFVCKRSWETGSEIQREFLVTVE
jgi:predicted secreted protein